jgi:hypothetical protein
MVILACLTPLFALVPELNEIGEMPVAPSASTAFSTGRTSLLGPNLSRIARPFACDHRLKKNKLTVSDLRTARMISIGGEK